MLDFPHSDDGWSWAAAGPVGACPEHPPSTATSPTSSCCLSLLSGHFRHTSYRRVPKHLDRSSDLHRNTVVISHLLKWPPGLRYLTKPDYDEFRGFGPAWYFFHRPMFYIELFPPKEINNLRYTYTSACNCVSASTNDFQTPVPN